MKRVFFHFFLLPEESLKAMKTMVDLLLNQYKLNSKTRMVLLTYEDYRSRLFGISMAADDNGGVI